MSAINPIKSVTPIDSNGTETGPAVTTLPGPTTYKYGLHDISGSGAGRNEALVMTKMRKGQSKDVELEWAPISIADCAAVLQAFDSEYVRVEFLDAKAGAWIIKDFYVGDRGCPLLDANAPIAQWESVGFTIIQRNTDK